MWVYFLLVGALFAQPDSTKDGVKAPALIHKVEPIYSEAARTARICGTVVLGIIVDQGGVPQNLRVLKPLGLGLDEAAMEAVRQWRFRPGTKDGKVVNVQATVEVNFVLDGCAVPPQTMEQLQKQAAGSDISAGPALVELARHAFNGNPANPTRGIEYLTRAADLGFARAQTQLALRYLQGNGVSKDEKKGFALAMRAADQGDPDGLNLVGWAYHYGKGTNRDHSQAQRYYLQSAEKDHPVAMFNRTPV